MGSALAARVAKASVTSAAARARGGWSTSTIAVMPLEIDIRHVARLARLDLSEEELALYERQLGDIIEHAARVQALDTEGVAPTAHPLPMTNAFRSDEVGRCLDREEVLGQVPDRREGYVGVPPALETE